jgi:hypothetical protein
MIDIENNIRIFTLTVFNETVLPRSSKVLKDPSFIGILKDRFISFHNDGIVIYNRADYTIHAEYPGFFINSEIILVGKIEIINNLAIIFTSQRTIIFDL